MFRFLIKVHHAESESPESKLLLVDGASSLKTNSISPVYFVFACRKCFQNAPVDHITAWPKQGTNKHTRRQSDYIIFYSFYVCTYRVIIIIAVSKDCMRTEFNFASSMEVSEV